LRFIPPELVAEHRRSIASKTDSGFLYSIRALEAASSKQEIEDYHCLVGVRGPGLASLPGKITAALAAKPLSCRAPFSPPNEKQSKIRAARKKVCYMSYEQVTDSEKPLQDVVANTLKLRRNGALASSIG
jgi:hypothetical protein